MKLETQDFSKKLLLEFEETREHWEYEIKL